MKALVLVACFLVCSTVIGEEFQVEELELRNMRHHHQVVKVEIPEDVPSKDEKAVTKAASGSTSGTLFSGGSLFSGGPTGLPPSYDINNGPQAGAQGSGSSSVTSCITTILLSLAFLLLFV